MTSRILATLSALLLLAGFLHPARAQAPACALSALDQEWADTGLRQWAVVEREALKLPPVPLPRIVLADERCTAIGPQESRAGAPWQGTPHTGSVQLPDGNAAPIGPISFAAPDPRGGERAAFFAMSLPSVWRTRGITSGLGLETMMHAVLLHEMAHTRQFAFVSPMLDQLTKKYGLPDDISDDSLQEAFAKNADYVKAYEAERDLLYAAAAARTDEEARVLAGQALARMRERRDRWFTGADEKWRGLDEVFLTMEGLGQWVAYWWLTNPQGLKVDRAVALREMRRGGRFWTQEEGLALFLVVDRLVPNWQARAFGAQPALAEALLAAAAARR